MVGGKQGAGDRERWALRPNTIRSPWAETDRSGVGRTVAGPLRSADRLRGAGSKEQGARSMCKTRQSGPVHSRGGATIGTGPAEKALTPTTTMSTWCPTWCPPSPKGRGEWCARTPNHPSPDTITEQAERSDQILRTGESKPVPAFRAIPQPRPSRPASGSTLFRVFFRISGWGSLIKFSRENRPIRAGAIEFLENSARAE